MAKDYKPIPIPPERRWREFRIRYIPTIVFVAVAGVVALLWQESVVPTQMVGLGVADQYQISSPREGMLHELNKSRFDLVDADEPILALYPLHTERLQAELEVILAEVQLIRAGLEPVTGQQRNRLNYEELRLEMMNARIQLAADRLQRDRLQRERERSEQLFSRDLISIAEYDLVVTEYEIFTLKVRESEEVLNDLATRLNSIAGAWDDNATPESALQAAITVKEKELKVLEADLAPLRIAAPAGGIISDVLRRNGEYVAAGEPILFIREQALDYVVGYLRQPISRVPDRGAEVQIYSKSRGTVFNGVIAQIGFQLEPIHEALLRPGMTVEYALPVRIHVEEGTTILPGEVVDIRL